MKIKLPSFPALNRIKFVSIAFFFAMGLATCVLLNSILPPFFAEVFFGDGEAFPFTFQMGMWIPFFYGLHGLWDRHLEHQIGRGYFQDICKPVNEEKILDGKDFADYLKKARPLARKHVSLVPNVVMQVILKYQSSRSVEQTSNMLSSLLELAHHKLELKYSKLRYLSWLIPTLGFMGTVYGISMTVDVVGTTSPDDPNLLSNIASNLAVAFNTTLLALVQSAILILVTNYVEEKEEGSINLLGEYVLEHIINRVH